MNVGDMVVISRSIEDAREYTRLVGKVGEITEIDDDLYKVLGDWWYESELDLYVEIEGDFSSAGSLI